MKIRFSLEYLTYWGQSLHVAITFRRRDGGERSLDLPMQTADGALWTLETQLPEARRSPWASFTYAYQVEDAAGKTLRREWDTAPRAYALDPSIDYIMRDAWRDAPTLSHLYTDAYATAVGAKRGETARPIDVPLFARTIVFRASAPQLKAGQALAVCGSHPALGQWSPRRYQKMEYAGQRQWLLSVSAAGMELPVEYKYVVVDGLTGELLAWEEGDNRTTGAAEIGDGQALALDDGVARVRESVWRAAGVSISVAALRGDNSCGAGDFGDLRRLVDWAVAAGMKVIHTTTVNAPSSAFALNPLLIDLEAAGELADGEQMNTHRRRRRELETKPESDREAALRVKDDYMRRLFAERGQDIIASDDCQRFLADNRRWLLPYTAHTLLRQRFATADTAHWEDYAAYDDKLAAKLAAENADEAAYILFTQYTLHAQLAAAAAYARKRGVALMVDFAFGVAADSADVWANPGLFNAAAETGAMPSSALPDGQKWGQPAYRWQAAERSGYRWWRERLAKTSEYFDAIRLCRPSAYFRVWETAPGEPPSMGRFEPSLPLTVEEIEAMGLKFRRELFTRPLITDTIIARLFGLHAQYVRETFLKRKAYNMYELRPECETQRQIDALFAGKRDEDSLWISDGLSRLAAGVLFVADRSRPDTFHPRAGAYKLPIYKALGDDEREAFMRVYNNYYHARHDDHWAQTGLRRLSSVLGTTRLLAVAGGDGPLPESFEAALDALRILPLRRQTEAQGDGREFARLNANPYRSAASFSTQATPPMRLWWELNPERAQRYFDTMLQKEGRAPLSLPAHIAEEIIARHLYCPSMLCLLTPQDWTAMDPRLRRRDPREESPANEGFRLHLSIEELLQADGLNQKIRTMITRSRR